ncbi:MAG: hypothetical protein KDA99_04335 [Planctomycetales bacterium]|nr:hypothetical protein [Planctomycetales bacterium]
MQANLFIIGALVLAQAAPTPDVDLKQQVAQLVTQLDAEDAQLRQAAEQQLVELGPNVLSHLPVPGRDMAPEIKTRLQRVRSRLETLVAEQTSRASRVTLKGTMPLSEALEKIQQQTGNKIVDYRDRFGQQSEDASVSVELDGVPFWQALDEVLDQVGLTPYPYSGELRTLAIRGRDEGQGPNTGRVAYHEIFRFEATRIQAMRNLRNPEEKILRLSMEISWEPRVVPISITQPMDLVNALGSDGSFVEVDNRLEQIEVSIQNTVGSVEMDIPFHLPDRSITSIKQLRGTAVALVPGMEHSFEFEDLADSQDVPVKHGDVAVVLQRTRKNGSVHDVRILVQFDEASGALESHRAWIYSNEAYLINPQGERVENAGFETTRQLPSEIGLSYKFAVAGELEGYRFVYRTPAGIMRIPVEFELKDIPLP